MYTLNISLEAIYLADGLMMGKRLLSYCLLLFLFLFTSVAVCLAASFTTGMSTRNAPGPFAGAVFVQGDPNNGSSLNDDLVTFDRGDQINGQFYQNIDANQGSVVFWFTPEETLNVSSDFHFLWTVTEGSLDFYYQTGSLILRMPGNNLFTKATTLTAGTTYLIVARWDHNNTLDNTNHACITVDDSTSCGNASVDPAQDPGSTGISIGGWFNGEVNAYAANGLIEGFTVYRRPLYEATTPSGINVGNGDEIAAIYASGSGKDPTLVTGSWDVVFALPTNSSTGSLSTTGQAWSHPHSTNLLGGTNGKNGFMMDGTYGNDGWLALNGDTQTLTLQPDEAAGIDTYVRSGAVDSNYSGSYVITTSNLSDRNIGLLKFDLSSIPSNATINSATLSLWNASTATNNRTFTLYSILEANSAWTDAGATWNYAVATTRWAGDTGSDGGADAGCSVSGTDFNGTAMGTFTYTANNPAGTEHQASLNTSQVQAWLTANYGVELQAPANAGGLQFVSSDYPDVPGLRPKLVVNYTVPPTVTATSTNQKIFAGGYKWTNTASNQGLYQDITVDPGDDIVVRAVANSDTTSIPKIILYDQTNGAEIGSLTGTNTSTRTAPDIFIFTGEVPAGSTTLRVKLVNTQASGTVYWHQVEVLSNLITNPSVETGSNNPWIPTGWSNASLVSDEGVQGTGATNVHSGLSSLNFVTNTAYHGLFHNSFASTYNKFYALGFWAKVISGSLRSYMDTSWLYDQSTNTTQQKTVTNSSWTLYHNIVREAYISGGLRNSKYDTPSIGTSYLDDVYSIALDAVSLILTPASLANSTENTDEIRVDGTDTYIETAASSLGTGSGFTSFSWRPRHSAALASSFDQGSDDAYILSLTDSDNSDYVNLFWDSANTLKLAVNTGSGEATDTWDATGAIVAGTQYAIVLQYTNGGNVTVSIGGTERLSVAMADAFDEAPDDAYFGSSFLGAYQGDATFSDIVFDNTPPSGGSISYTSGYYTTASVSLTVADGTDAISGINTSSRITQRKSATLSNGSCQSYGGFATITPTGTYPDLTDSTVVSGNCYQYQYLVSDNSGNQATYTSASVAKVDTSLPSAPGTPSTTSPTNSSSQTWSWTAAVNLISGIANYLWRVTGTIVTSGTTAVNSVVTNLSEGVYTFFVKAVDNAGHESEETSATLTVDQTAAVISGITVTTPTSTQATINWTTSENASSKVDYGLTNSYGSTTNETDTAPRVTDHEVALTSLSACTSYHYRVRSKDAVTNERVSSDNTFTTIGCTASAPVTAAASEQITATGGGTLVLQDDSSQGLTLTIPADFSDTDANFQVHQLEQNTVLETTSTPTGYTAAGDYIYEIKALTDNTTTVSNFDTPLTVTISYGVNDISGIDESSLKIYSWDGSLWSQLTGCSVDTSAKTSTCTTTHFSIFALFGQANSSGNSSSASNTSQSSTSNSSSTSCGDPAPGLKAPWLYSAASQNSDSILLSFTEADDPLTTYVLEYGTKSGDYSYGSTNIGPKGTRTYLVRSLSANTSYYFRVRAANGCANGPWSNEISAKTKGLVSLNQLDIVQSELEVKPVEETKKIDTCQTYTVKADDTLWKIAKNLLGSGNKYQEIINQNKASYPSLETSNSVRKGWELKFNCQEEEKTATQNVSEPEAPKSYDVKVKVVDENKQPVAGATVTLHSTPQTTTTDKDGIAQFHNVEQGDHQVLIAYNNFEGEQSLNLTGEVKEFDLKVTVQQKTMILSPQAMIIISVLVLIIFILSYFIFRRQRMLN